MPQKENKLVQLLTMEEVCEWLKIDIGTLYKWVSTGKIPSIKVGKFRRFEAEELRKWKKRRTERAA